MTAILASMFFGAISGSSPATVVAIGALLYPAMIEKGYSKEFSAGVITAAGSLGIIIPPSVNMIVYGTVTGASVGALFMSGFGAGIVYGLSFVVYTFFYAKRHPEIQRETRKTWGERLVAIKESIWGMGVPIIIRAVSTAACLLQRGSGSCSCLLHRCFPVCLSGAEFQGIYQLCPEICGDHHSGHDPVSSSFRIRIYPDI